MLYDIWTNWWHLMLGVIVICGCAGIIAVAWVLLKKLNENYSAIGYSITGVVCISFAMLLIAWMQAYDTHLYLLHFGKIEQTKRE